MKPLNYEYIEPNPSRQYTDINIAFTQHPITGDIAKKSGNESIKQSLRNLVLLNKNEKPFHPEIGGGIYEMLFENMDEPGIIQKVKYDLINVITQWEPRVDLTGIEVEPNYDSNSVTISIYYVILNTLEPNNVEIFLKLVR